jgi:hypothetical protein
VQHTANTSKITELEIKSTGLESKIED